MNHKTVYGYIYAYPKGMLKKMMINSLSGAKFKQDDKGSKTSHYSNIKLTDEQKIEGHWEVDLLLGAKNQSCVGILVERKTGYLILSKMKSQNISDIRQDFERQMKEFPSFLRLPMTCNRGAKTFQHSITPKNLSIKIYFADPHSSHQGGSNENINGLIRQFLPKEVDLSHYSQSELDKIACLLNTRPRKRFDFKTPQELFEPILTDYINDVALKS